jgi:predicted transcriptional regulator of viral defense system
MIKRGENMILTNDIIKSNLTEYSNKNTKICRDVKNGNLIKIINGLYETDSSVNGYLLAGSIYGPSYLSFEFALYYYGLIPEKVTSFTSATCDKKKKKSYTNFFGTYMYRDVPKDVYPLGIKLIQEGEYTYQIATPEKALCDKLYTLSPIKNMTELENMLFNDLRIDNSEFRKLNIDDIEQISKVYHSTNVSLLYRYMRRTSDE